MRLRDRRQEPLRMLPADYWLRRRRRAKDALQSPRQELRNRGLHARLRLDLADYCRKAPFLLEHAHPEVRL